MPLEHADLEEVSW